MAFRGRGRGRGFGRGKPSSVVDQLIIPTEKPTVLHSSTYPTLEYFPAVLSTHPNYGNMLEIKNQILSYFQSSSYHLKMEDETAKLFSIQKRTTCTKKTTLNFDWDFFPLELRPTSKRKLKSEEEILTSLRKNKMVSLDMAWFDKLEERESVEVMSNSIVEEECSVKKEPYVNGDNNDDEAEEFDDEELDFDNDYDKDYFDNGEDYLDEENEQDEGPYF